MRRQMLGLTIGERVALAHLARPMFHRTALVSSVRFYRPLSPHAHLSADRLASLSPCALRCSGVPRCQTRCHTSASSAAPDATEADNKARAAWVNSFRDRQLPRGECSSLRESTCMRRVAIQSGLSTSPSVSPLPLVVPLLLLTEFLTITFTRASGPGGQNVNKRKSSSAAFAAGRLS